MPFGVLKSRFIVSVLSHGTITETTRRMPFGVLKWYVSHHAYRRGLFQ